jgi:hypothetical protein
MTPSSVSILSVSVGLIAPHTLHSMGLAISVRGGSSLFRTRRNQPSMLVCISYMQLEAFITFRTWLVLGVAVRNTRDVEGVCHCQGNISAVMQ